MAASSNSPCGACKFLRRKCAPECAFAPYFPPDQPLKFSNAHKIFGASNIAKILSELPLHQRAAAVNSLAYEAQARMKDPVYGCVGAISYLRQHIEGLENEIRAAKAELARYHHAQVQQENTSSSGLLQQQHDHQRHLPIHLQATPLETTLPIMQIAGAADHHQHAVAVHPQATSLPILSSSNHDRGDQHAAATWILQQQRHVLPASSIYEADFADNSLQQGPSMQMVHGAAATGGHFLHARTAGHIDGRSPSSGEGVSNHSTLSSP